MYLIQTILVVAMATTAARQCLQMYSDKGNKLIGHTLKREFGGDLIKCFQGCKVYEQCQSINFKANDPVCEFNNRTREGIPSHFVVAEEWMYFDNPFKTLIGSTKNLPGRSCKEIRDNAGGIPLANKEYWINPTNTLTPMSVYCDMETDGGGWTLIARTAVTVDNEKIGRLNRKHNYREISNYAVNNLRIDVPAVGKLREDMGFSQLRYFCRKKNVGRTFHIITNKNTRGRKVVDYFTKGDHLQQRNASESYFRGPGDDSVLASNCGKWGSDEDNSEVGKWGYYQHNGTYRIYNDPVYWNGTEKKYFTNFLPEYLCCDDDKNKRKPLSKGDIWEIYVR